ncbi:MAG: hypothetical protein KZQ83_05200 [gamma proteobacterium symbiont of Taylorina sp.]|nr:hypothetical protein [gamma proteobacterium symbiont of Taylorina sp.]
MLEIYKKPIKLLILFFIITLYSAFFSPIVIAASNNYMKCWINAEGLTECGNRVPREFYNQRVRFIDSRGITREIKEKSKTREEILAEQKTIQEEEDRLIRENGRLRKIKENDDILLKTYLTVDDLLGSMNSKLDITNSRINILQLSLPLKKQKFDGLVRNAANAERSGKKISEHLISKLNALRAEIKNTKAQLIIEETKKKNIKQIYRNDVERFVFLNAQKLNKKLKTKQQNKKLHAAKFQCRNKVQCNDNWKLANVFFKEFSSTDVIYETALFSVSDTPENFQDIAMSLSLLDKEGDAKILLLQIRCLREAKGKAFCKKDKVTNLLSDFQNLNSTDQ